MNMPTPGEPTPSRIDLAARARPTARRRLGGMPHPMRGHGGRRILTTVVFLLVYAVMDRVYMKPYLETFGLYGIPRQTVSALLLGMALLVPLIVLTSTYTTDWSLARLARPKTIATLCALSTGWLLAQILGSGQRIAVVETPLGYLGVLAIVWFAVYRYARRSHGVHRRRLLRLENIPDADTLVGICERDLKERALTADERAAVELNLASALVTLSRRGDRHDRLPEAHDLIAGVAARCHPAWTFAAAERLVEAIAVKAERTGEHEGYESALNLLSDAAEAAADLLPDAPSRAHAIRAASLVALGEQAASDGDPLRHRELRDRADAEFQRSYELVPERRRLRAERVIAHASGAGANPLEADLDASIRRCRRALGDLVLSSWDLQARGMLALADLLTLRAVLEEHGRRDTDDARAGAARRFVAALAPSRMTRDRACALALCLLVIFMFQLTPEARKRVPGLLRDLGVERRPLLRRWGARRIERSYEEVYREQAGASAMSAVEVAASWARWTAERADAASAADGRRARRRGTIAQPSAATAAAIAAAAEAHWCWIRAVVADTRRRTVLDAKQRRLSRVDGQAAQACAWLLKANRTHDAALVLELGRAVLLTERMSRERPGIEDRLVAAGRLDLRDEWRTVRDRMAHADRLAFGDGARSADPRSDGASAGAFATAEYLALTDHERLLRELSEVPGCEDVDAPLNYDDLRAAAAEGPVVYVSLTERGGSAIVVTSSSEPDVVALPRLTVARLNEHAPLLLDPRLGAWAQRRIDELSAELRALLPWLWQELMEPLTSRLEPGCLVTLIAGGALGQLPVPAACAGRDASGIWRDRTGGMAFRCVPNARVLLRAQRVARETSAAKPRLLTVAVPHSPAGDLRYAEAESRGVLARAGAAGDEQLCPGTVDAVMAALERCGVWHLACHGRHKATAPLESHLALADGEITLRTIFSGPSAPRRLAVLSACQTASSDASQLDEVVSFPSALLQAGVAGVVCAHALVFDDEAAMLLVLRFFDVFTSGRAPARALADAQDWLRGATSADIHDAFPDAYALAPYGSPGERPFADPDAWATFVYSGA